MKKTSNDGQVHIDRGIPIPKNVGGRHTTYPWAAMEVGDSFLLAGKHASILSYARHAHAPRKFTCRKTSEGFRIWRTE